MEKEYKYDAFISYRHCELDKFVAEKLHKILEGYELPKNIKKKLNIKDRTFKRIFRDQEELPLSSNLEDPIVEALNNSKYLIVICSPRLKESLWCKREIETFKKIRGRKNIFCVLVEGEPSDSFPEEVLYDEEEVIKDGKKIIQRIPFEPLAADVRGSSKKEVLKKIKEEKLRLVAPMYNLDYDDLKQRHKLRKQKRILTISIIVTIFCILFALYTSIMLIKINNQQNILKKHQALSLASDSEEYLSKDSRYDAVKTAYQALTTFNGVKMPYTAAAEYALTESLGIYDVGSSYKVVNELKTEGVVDYIKGSYDNKIIAIYDESDAITLFESETLNIINKYSVKDINEHSFTFIGNDIFSYIDKDGNINLVNIKDNKLIKKIDKVDISYISIKGEETGNYLSYVDLNTLYIYDIKEDKEVLKISSKDKYLKDIYYSEDSNYLFVGTSISDVDVAADDYLIMHVIDIKNKKEINSLTLKAGYISGVLTNGDNAYLLLNNIKIGTLNTLVVSYNYINNTINWSKIIDNVWGSILTKSYKEGSNSIGIVCYDSLITLNSDNGNTIETFTTRNEIINAYSFINEELYLLILSDGSVNYINMKNKTNIEYIGEYEFNLDSYTKVTISEYGFLLVPKNENRVILYEQKTNENIEEVNITVDDIKEDEIKLKEYDTLKEEYDIKNKNLVDNMFYDKDKKLLFVNYVNEDINIYRVSDKKLLKTLNKVGKVDKYYGKDKNNRIYIGSSQHSYILDKNYDKVGHIKGLYKLEEDKVIIYSNGKYYSIKIYNLEDILKEAKEYLNK